MIDVLSTHLGDPQTRLSRGGFIATVIYAAIFFYTTLFGAAVVMGLVAAAIEIASGAVPPDDLLLQVTAAFLALASGAVVAVAGASRIRDMGRSVLWLVPGSTAFAVFVVSQTGMMAAPEEIVSASIVVIAATLLALSLLPGRSGIEGGTYLQVGDKLIKLN